MASDTRLTLSYDVSNATTPTYHAYADYNFVMTFTANEGYEFIIGDSANFLEYADSSTWQPSNDRYVTVDSVVKQVKMTTQMKDYPTSAIMHVKAYQIQPVSIPLTQNLVNCTSNVTDSSVNPSTSLSIILTADNYCKFESQSATYTINGDTRYFAFRSGNSNVYADFISPASGTIIVNATAVDTRYEVGYTLSNCSVTPVISRIDYSDNITFTVTADSGYRFDTTNQPYYTCGGLGDKHRLTRIDDYTYTLNSNNVYIKGDLYIYATALQEITPPVPTTEITYGFLNIYLPTTEILKSLSKRRFRNSDTEIEDMFKYVYKVQKMYFNIPATIETTIALAYYRTGITCLATDNAFVNVDCGSVIIPELYGNIFDYQYTTSKIYLPFIGYQSIETTDIMNSTVNLEYRANIVTGKTIAIISTTERGELYQFEGYGGFDIPYMINNFSTAINHDLYQSSAYLGSFIPSIQLITSIPYGNDNNNPFGYGVSKWTKINDCTGYIKCQDIQFILSQNFITNSEMNMITELLKDGVFI